MLSEQSQNNRKERTKIFLDRADLEKAYVLSEQTRMQLWKLILQTPDIEEEYDKDAMINEHIQVEDIENGTKIVIKDLLPRNANLPLRTLREHWMSLMHHALKRNRRPFKKILCVIKIVAPGDFWDVDNRAYKIILDSLRYNRLIPNDTSKYLSFMVLGDVDIDFPRTEIYLYEHPENILDLVAKG
jgi:hypothetical protein